MKKITTLFFAATIAITSVFAQTSGFSRADLKHPAKAAKTARAAKAGFTFDDITFWVGKGSNRSALAVQWNDPRETNALVWGYNWDGTKYGVDILFGVAKEDPRFFVLAEATTSGYGAAIAGVGYDANNDGLFFIKDKTTGTAIYPDENGVLAQASGYNYDNFIVGDPEDFWGAGWSQSYWSYWLGTDGDNWSYSGVGASGRKLSDGSWDGWNFALGMSSQPWKPSVAAPAPGYNTGTFILSDSAQSRVLSVLDKKGNLSYNIYGTENPSLPLYENTHNIIPFGANMYIVSDEYLLIADVMKITKKAEINISNGRSFVGINENKGYLGTGNGIYVVNIGDPPSLGAVIENTNAETGAMLYSNVYLFAVQKNKGIVVINTSTNTVETTINGNYILLTQSTDGTVWAGAGTTLTKINPFTLETEDITLPANTALSTDWNDWNSKLFFADIVAPALYWVNSGYTANPNSVFQYEIGRSSSLTSPLFSLPDEAGLSFSKAAISMNYQVKQLTVSADNLSGSAAVNKIYMVDVSTGDVLNTFTLKLNSNITNIAYPDKASKIALESSYSFALNAQPLVIPLAGKLSDPDNLFCNITRAVISDNETLVTAAIVNDNLIITPQAGESGNAKLNFFATSNGVTSKKSIDIVVTRALESIAFSYNEKTIKRGGKDTLNVIFTPDNATNKTLSWTRKSNKVSVSNGIVTGSAAGNDTVTATSADGDFVAVCAYTVVENPLTGMSFDKDTVTIAVGQKDTLGIIFNPDDAYNKSITMTQNPTGKISTQWVNYTSTSGLLIITGSNSGTVTLSGKTADGGFIDTCTVNIFFDSATSLVLNADTVDLTVPATFALKGTFLPEGKSNTKITWTSRNTSIATVNASGTVTSVSAGETWIVAVSADDLRLMDSVLVRVDFIPVTEFSIISNDTFAGINKSIYAGTSFAPNNASSKTIAWSSSDAAVATVSASGTSGYITGKKVGTAWIYATTNTVFKDSIFVTVDSVHVTDFALREDMKELWKKTGNMWYPHNTILPDAATNKTIQYSFENDVIDYYSSGSTYIKAVKLGDCKVYFSTADGGFKDTMLVHVVESVTSLALDIKDTAIIVGDVVSLNPIILPEQSIKTVTWTSSDNTVADVDVNGNITALKEGEAMIIATSADVTTKKDTCYVTVSNQISQSIEINTTEKTLLAGDKWTVKATVLPANTTNKRLMWVSSDYSVLDVDANGVVTAIKAGNATVGVYAKDNGAYKSCLVSVDTLNYTQGVFFVNEDWFGHNNSSLNFLTSSGVWVYNVYQKENPGKELGATSPYGTVYGDKLYIVSKQEKDNGAAITGSRLAVCDAKTLKSLGEFTVIGQEATGPDGRSFLGVNENKGYIGTSSGIYLFDMENLTMGASIAGSAGTGDLYSEQTGTMVQAAGKVFAVNQKKGVLVINAEKDSIETVIGGPKDGNSQRGFGSIVQSKDGNLWLSVASDLSGAGNTEDYILKLDPYTLDTTRILLPSGAGIPNSWYAWTADGFCSSKQQNKLYWKNNAGWFNATKIYCYDIDSEQTEILFDLANYDDGDWGFYGAAFRIDPVSNDIFASLFRDFSSRNYRVIRINTNTKTVENSYQMDAHYWFPAMPVFPDNFAPSAANIQDTNVAELQAFNISLKDIATDDDNLDAAITVSVVSLSDSAVLTAQVVKDGLLITPKSNGECLITVRFNSNGKTVDRTFTVVVSSITVGSEDSDIVKTHRISIYPNPFTDYIVIDATFAGVATVYDLQGRTVLNTPVSEGYNRINTSALKHGTYILKCGNNTVKIIK
ncbi:MAG: DUF5074 domain-containing protein [Bacteroidales bacterium]|jgi:uncharacterized protein YjdB|nr:DUF5074 domain-containing protein [Bacteroidales bacterium]